MTDATTTSTDADLDAIEARVAALDNGMDVAEVRWLNYMDSTNTYDLHALIAELRLLRAIHEEMPKWVMEQEEPLIEKCATCGTRYGDAHADNCELAAYQAWQAQGKQ